MSRKLRIGCAENKASMEINRRGFPSSNVCSLLLVISVLLSVGLILLVTMNSHSRAAYVVTDPAQGEDKTYRKPRWMDQRLDWCFVWGKDCGQPAADHFCRRRRFSGAKDFRAEPNVGTYEPTRLAGSNQVCNQPFCTGFEYITCFGPLPTDQVFAPPVWSKSGVTDCDNEKCYRLDWCLNWEKDCGKPAADAFCRANGFPESLFYLADPGVGTQPTMLIGTGQICNAPFCTAFQMITCKPKPPPGKPMGKAKPSPQPAPTTAPGIRRITTPVIRKHPFE